MSSSTSPIRLLGLFAHPDDEVFCVGGTFARYAAEGAETMVVSFTRGEAGQIRDARVATRRTLGEVRAAELRRSCEQLGVRHVRCLDFGDGQMQRRDFNEMVAAAVAIIRQFRPDIVFTFDDSGAYGHPDHIIISRVTTAACRLAGLETYPAGDYPGFAPQLLYHAYFPRNDRLLLKHLVDWLQTLDTKFRGEQAFTHALLLFADESSMLGYASDHLKIEWFPKGFYVIEQGEPAVSLYLILSGAIDVVVENGAGDIRYIATFGPGVFLGETGIAHGAPRNAHCIAVENSTCLVFSPGEPTNFAGRGEEAQYMVANADPGEERPLSDAVIDVTEFVEHKVRALSQHRSQYPMTPNLFPLSLMQEILGVEHFIQAWPPPRTRSTLL